MRAVIQRVQRSKVTVEDKTVAEIGPGLLILLGIGPGDDEEKARAMAKKIALMRIFEDEHDRKLKHARQQRAAEVAFRHIVLGPFLHGGQGQFLVTAARENDDRAPRGNRLHGAKSRQPVTIRQRQVEQHDVELRVAEPAQAIGQIARPVERESNRTLRQRFGDEACVSRVVFDQ